MSADALRLAAQIAAKATFLDNYCQHLANTTLQTYWECPRAWRAKKAAQELARLGRSTANELAHLAHRVMTGVSTAQAAHPPAHDGTSHG